MKKGKEGAENEVKTGEGMVLKGQWV